MRIKGSRRGRLPEQAAHRLSFYIARSVCREFHRPPIFSNNRRPGSCSRRRRPPRKSRPTLGKFTDISNSPGTSEELCQPFQHHRLPQPTPRTGGDEAVPSKNDGGMIIDLSALHGVYRQGGAFCIEGGATLWNAYSQLYKEYGVTIPGGSCYTPWGPVATSWAVATVSFRASTA